jgi:hypothetical protein
MDQSTKLDDLPDNYPVDKIIQELKNADGDDNTSQQSENQIVSKSIISKDSYFASLGFVSDLKDSALVSGLLLVLTNKIVLTLSNNIPILNTYTPHSFVYNLIISIFIGILFFVIKVLMRFLI